MRGMALAATPLLSNAGELWRAGCGRILGDARQGGLRRLELAASPLRTPDQCSRGIAHRGSRVRGLPRACRVAPSGRRSEKLNNGGKFRAFDRDNYCVMKAARSIGGAFSPLLLFPTAVTQQC
jgi:hypothetical protein